ncbi:MAG: hypothetical protein HYY17_01795 [Planctomycetes bacterium]|nr:hypothetical protein [Planctomycetota bacterium]
MATSDGDPLEGRSGDDSRQSRDIGPIERARPAKIRLAGGGWLTREAERLIRARLKARRSTPSDELPPAA